MTTKEVSELLDTSYSTTAHWASKNEVDRFMNTHGIMEYIWTESDCNRFKNRKAGQYKNLGKK